LYAELILPQNFAENVELRGTALLNAKKPIGLSTRTFVRK